jgi:cytochrome c oxidase assembly protein subunit 15
VTLGVTTLLHYVPVSLGSAHQAGALTLFTLALALLHAVRPLQPGRVALALGRAAAPAALALTAAVGVGVTTAQ